MTHAEPDSETPMPASQKGSETPHNLPPEEDASLSMFALGKSSLMVLFAQGLQSIRGIVLLPFITRMLSAGDYGLWVQAGTLTSLLSPIATLYLGNAVLRFFAATSHPRDAVRALSGVFLTVGVLGIVATLAAVIASGGVAAAFFEGQRALVLLALLSLLPEAIASVCLAYFRTFRQMATFSLFSVARPYVELVVVIALLFNGHPLWQLLAAMALVRAVLTVVMVGMVVHETGWARPDFSPLPQYLRFSVPLMPTNLLLWITNASDRFVIGYHLGAASVGYYNPGYALGAIIAALSAPVLYVLPPFVYAHYDRGRPEVAMSYLSNTILLVAMTGLFAAAVFGGLSAPILTLLSTQEIARTGSLVTPFVALGVTAQTCTVVVSIALGCVKKTHLMAYSAFAGACLNLGLNIVFIPRYGIVAAAMTTLIAMLVDLSIRLTLARRHMHLPVQWSKLTRAAVAASIVALGLSSLDVTSVVSMLGLLVLSPTAYVGLLIGMRVVRMTTLKRGWAFARTLLN